MNWFVYIITVVAVLSIIPVDNKLYKIDTESGICFEIKTSPDELENRSIVHMSYEVFDTPNQWVRLKVFKSWKNTFLVIHEVNPVSVGQVFEYELEKSREELFYICFSIHTEDGHEVKPQMIDFKIFQKSVDDNLAKRLNYLSDV